MEVCGIDVCESDLAWLRERGDSVECPSRSLLAREFCDRKQLVDRRGNRREVAARVILRRLERRGELTLPRRQRLIPRTKRRKRKKSTPPDGTYRGTALSVRGLGEVEVVPVTRDSKPEHVQWTRLMESSHYLGTGPLCGAQIRYLVRCREGLLGALSFSASAWRLRCRDRFIEWSESARRRNLQLVVCNSRFLLLPRIPNLASRVLSLALRRLATDWEARYAYRPVLVESFVDSGRFAGSCYRAANWIHVGSTSGRGRQDRDHRADRGKKAVFVYPIEEEWREKLCVEPVSKPTEDSDWTEVEFSGAVLSDERLTKRLRLMAHDFFARPTANIPQACGSRARTKAAYRFCSHEHVTMEAILAPHFESTLKRAASEKIVLAIQDTTTVNYTTHPATEGLGPIGSVGARDTLGLQVHSTLAFNLSGTPLGLFDAQCWTRDPAEHGKARERERLPIEEKESRKWLLGYLATEKAQRRLGETRIVNVGDAEADIFELFARSRHGSTRPDLLVRASQPRKLESTDRHAPFVWEHVKSMPRAGQLPLVVPRSGSRPRRETTLALRFAEVRVRPPLISTQKAPVTMWAVAATEEAKPAAGERIEWLLLTTIPVTTVEEAAEKVSWYALRWQIEVFHRTLKSGCRIEDRQLGSMKSLEACLAVDLVVAWRIFHLTKLSRETPNEVCSVFFEDAQWKALVCFLNKTPIPPTSPPTLREATRMVAGLGGFLGRKSDGEPGTETLWRGLTRLDDITGIFDFFYKNWPAKMDTS